VTRLRHRRTAALLAVVYATLAAAGNALHQHSPTRAADSEASHSCDHCCRLHALQAAKTKACGDSGFSPQQDRHDSEHCLACQVLSQMKLGQASPPQAATVSLLRDERGTVIETVNVRRAILRIAARGPPVVLSTVA
jgi:hypothetical protein